MKGPSLAVLKLLPGQGVGFICFAWSLASCCLLGFFWTPLMVEGFSRFKSSPFLFFFLLSKDALEALKSLGVT